jgi:protein involved in polysaccharide export with SLBB domain
MKTLRLSLPARLLAGSVLTLIIAGCASRTGPVQPAPIAALTTPVSAAGRPSLDAALLQRPAEPFRLGPGDELEIEVLGDVATRARVVVGPDGKIYFYVLPGLDVWGLSLAETQQLISRELQNFVREPQPVSLTLLNVQSQRVWVLGRTTKPGVYPITGPTRLLEAISLAGGPVSASSFTSLTSATGIGSRGATDEAADLSRSFVIRQGKVLPVDFNRLLRDGDLSQNIYLHSDDFIYLPSALAQEVHVLGAVGQARTVNYTSKLTLAQAVATAGGSIPNAHTTHVAIVRGSLTEPQISIVDYKGIVHGRTPDVLLEANDIVYVPFTPYRTLTRYANLILDTFARTVGANEGARAFSDEDVSISVSVGTGGTGGTGGGGTP